jgi:nucleotide-binding universal stress UspA family protein
MPDNKVIVATDGSDHSLRVLPHADCLARALGAAIELVRVVERHDLAQEPNESPEAAAERARTRLEADMTADLKRFGINGATHVLVTGGGEEPADALLRVGAGGSLLAMHSRGRGGIARILHGSVAMGVVQKVAQPVLLGGPELLPVPVNGDTYRILAATDLSPDADNCLRVLAPLLEQGRFEVTLLHVHLHAPGGVDNDAERAKHEATLAQKRALLPAAVPVETRLREIPIGGGIDTAIMEEADRAGANAIAMATHGHSARRHLLMGSVALSILGRSRLPIIVSRAQG